MSHHSAHSGYDQLIQQIASRVIEPYMLHRLLDQVPERILANIRRTAGTWYNSQALKQELQNVPAFLFKSGHIYHFLYGEDSFHYSGYLNPRRSNKMVATFHMPPDKFREIMSGTRHLATLDAAVIVAPNQKEMLSPAIDPAKVHLIPHGVDIHFFQPARDRAITKKLIFVGSHMRNFLMLRRVIEAMQAHDPDLSFTIVTLKSCLEHFAGLKNTTLCAAIPEEELRDLYQSAALLLMPMYDCTANNAVLEAMACGLPVIATRVGGIDLYANDSSAILVAPDAVRDMADAALSLLNNKERLQAMAINARKMAEQFAWEVVADKMKALYLHLFDHH
jgi:glycosyltransferase involved in cell wall biosynthesis